MMRSFDQLDPSKRRDWTPATSWLAFQPLPVRLAAYVLVWAFVLMVILGAFLPLAAAGLEKVAG